MHFSFVGACFLLAATLGQASPVEPQSRNVSNDVRSTPLETIPLGADPKGYSMFRMSRLSTNAQFDAAEVDLGMDR